HFEMYFKIKAPPGSRRPLTYCDPRSGLFLLMLRPPLDTEAVREANANIHTICSYTFNQHTLCIHKETAYFSTLGGMAKRTQYNRIKDVLKEKGMTQADLADLLDVRYLT